MLRSRRSTSASVTAHQALFQATTWGFHLPKSLTAATEDTNNFFFEALFFNNEEEEERLVEEEEFLVTEEEEAFDEGEDFVEFLEEDLERRRSADSIRRAGVDEGNWARVPEEVTI